MAKLKLIGSQNYRFSVLNSKIESNLRQKMEFETLPFNVKRSKKRKAKTDSRAIQHNFQLSENYKNRARSFVQEFSQDPFSTSSAFLINGKGRSKQMSVFSWLDNLISLEKPSDNFVQFLQASEDASFDKSIKALHRVNKGQFCEDRVELALNVLLDNGVIESYERFEQHSKEDESGKDFKIVLDEDTEFDLDVKAGNSSSANETKVINVQHKNLTELVCDLTELCEKAA
jgi:hypothetical protein